MLVLASEEQYWSAATHYSASFSSLFSKFSSEKEGRKLENSIKRRNRDEFRKGLRNLYLVAPDSPSTPTQPGWRQLEDFLLEGRDDETEVQIFS